MVTFYRNLPQLAKSSTELALSFLDSVLDWSRPPRLLEATEPLAPEKSALPAFPSMGTEFTFNIVLHRSKSPEVINSVEQKLMPPNFEVLILW